MQTLQKIQIDVYSDIVCPWCYIGQRRLEQALELVANEVEVEVVHRPFLLDPHVPPEGRDLREYLSAKYGGDPERMFAHVVRAARQSGLELDFTNIRRYPNTVGAHALLLAARDHLSREAHGQLLRDLFSAYFVRGEDLSPEVTLGPLAAQHGLSVDVARAASDPAWHVRVREEVTAASALGISGVPFFVLAGRLAASGAHPPETLADAIRRSLEEGAPG